MGDCTKIGLMASFFCACFAAIGVGLYDAAHFEKDLDTALGDAVSGQSSPHEITLNVGGVEMKGVAYAGVPVNPKLTNKMLVAAAASKEQCWTANVKVTKGKGHIPWLTNPALYSNGDSGAGTISHFPKSPGSNTLCVIRPGQSPTPGG